MAGLRLSLIATAVLLLVGQILAVDVPDYKVGDTAVEDVVARAPLSVVDVDATKALWKKEAERIPFIFLQNTNAPAAVEKNFRAAVVRARNDFLKAYNVSAHRPPSPEYFPLPGFPKFLMSLRESNGIPLFNYTFAEKWAKGQSDEAHLKPLVERLRKSMAVPIRPDALPADISVNDTVCIVNADEPNLQKAEDTKQLHATTVPVKEIISLTEARLAMEEQFPEDRAMGKYVASFLRPNCVPDAGLTAHLRFSDGEPLVVADHYNAGEIIVKRGEVVTSKAAAALRQLAAPPVQKTASKFTEPKAAEKAASHTPANAPAESSVKEPSKFFAFVLGHSKWIYIIGAGVLVVLLAAIQLIRRRRKRSAAANGNAAAQNRAPIIKRAWNTVARIANAAFARFFSRGSQMPSMQGPPINPHDAMASYGLGIMYANGLGVEQNWVEGYARLALSAGAGEHKDLTKTFRDLEKKMTSEQITQGQKRAQQLKDQILAQNPAPGKNT